MSNVPKLLLPFTTDKYILDTKVILKNLKHQKYKSNKEIETLDKMISFLQTSNQFSCREISTLIVQRETLKLFHKSIIRNMNEMGREVQRMRLNNYKSNAEFIRLYKKAKSFIINGYDVDRLFKKELLLKYNKFNEDKLHHLTYHREKHGLDVFGYDSSEFNKGKRK